MESIGQQPVVAEAAVSYDEASQRYIQVLRQALHDAENTETQSSHYLPDISDLANEVTLQRLRIHFYKTLQSTKSDWTPKGNVVQIIRACANEQFEELDSGTIEFYKKGNIRGVIALFLATQLSSWVFTQLEVISEYRRTILIEEATKIKINEFIPSWVESCNRSQGIIFETLA
jgi:hypothetical protein